MATTGRGKLAQKRRVFGASLCLCLLAVLLLVHLAQGAGALRDEGIGYEALLFDKGRVHTIEIDMADWEGFLSRAPLQEYLPAALTIDGEAFPCVGLRVKGGSSCRLTQQYGLSRYSLKVEFDHYAGGCTYHGLDKISLDASFQDNSYLKNYLVYDMMAYMEVPSPLCSYAWVRVNGQDWGLFLVVEEPEEAFARRCFGPAHGQLYKPEYKTLEAPNGDIALQYLGEDAASYDNIFRTARFPVRREDKRRLIRALRLLSAGENLEESVFVDEVLRYFTVQVFVVNLDSYLGRTGHNYLLYEKDGRLGMLPWDYNLAFATYSLGMPQPVNNAELYINFPIDTPNSGQIMTKRPLYHNLMKQPKVFALYHQYFAQLLDGYFEGGRFEALMDTTAALIAPYVQRDPTAFCSYRDHVAGVDTLRRFCLLRAESVRGQLEGQIPSTLRGQRQDDTAFVNAPDVWLPDMGELADLDRRKQAAARPPKDTAPPPAS